MYPNQKGTIHIFGLSLLLLIMGLAVLIVSCQLESAPTVAPAATPTATPGVTLVIPAVETVELPFETVERENWNKERVNEQRMVLVTNQSEIEQLKNHISTEAMEQLSKLDYEKYFVIAVFRRGRPTTGYDVVIERVVKQSDKIVVYVQFWEPAPYSGFSEVMTDPYHVVKVQRPDIFGPHFEIFMQTILITPTPKY